MQRGALNLTAWALMAACTLCLSEPVAAELQAPEQVSGALKEFAKDHGDLVRKLESHAYARMAREDRDFQRDAAALRKAIAAEPAEFRGRVESLLDRCLQESAQIARLSASPDEAQLAAALERLKSGLQDLNALFPDALRANP